VWDITFTIEDLADLNRALGFFEAHERRLGDEGDRAFKALRRIVDKVTTDHFHSAVSQEEIAAPEVRSALVGEAAADIAGVGK